MTGTVMETVGPPDSGRKIDKETMRKLLEMGERKFRKERDLDLYLLESDTAPEKILVLDNELAVYNTTPEDVALRRSPTVKEMLSIRNVIRILNDSDVVISKREASVRTIQKECIDLLDLSFDRSDLDDIKNDGAASLERGYADGVTECLSLFAELLGYRPPPKTFRNSNFEIIGALVSGKPGEKLFGPMVIYSFIHNAIRLIDKQMSTLNKEDAEFVYQIAMGKEKAPMEGVPVLEYLRDAVIRQSPENMRGKE